MTQHNGDLIAVTMLLTAWSSCVSSNLGPFGFGFFIQLDVTKYSRLVHQSPNLWRHVYIAAHVR